MGNRTSKQSKGEKQGKSGKKGRKIKQNATGTAGADADPDMLNSPTDMEDDIPLIESVSEPLIAEIEEAYDLKQNGGFKRLFHCVTSSLKFWIPQIQLMEKSCKILWYGDFGADDIKVMVRQILLWNKTYTSSNPRNGLLIRLMATQRDAADTMVESFAEMRSLLTQDVLNEKWGSKVRNHMASLQSMFDTYSRKQQLFEKRLRLEHGKSCPCAMPAGTTPTAKARRCIICHSKS